MCICVTAVIDNQLFTILITGRHSQHAMKSNVNVYYGIMPAGSRIILISEQCIHHKITRMCSELTLTPLFEH